MESTHIVHGPQPVIPVSELSLGEQLYHNLVQHQQIPVAFTHAETGENVPYKTILETSCRLAESLRKNGFGHNDVLGIFSENNLEYFYAIAAAMFLGATVTTFNPHYIPDEILHAANISNPKIIFCSKTTLPVLKTVKLNSVKKIIVLDGQENQEYESLQNFINGNTAKNFYVADFKPKKVNVSSHVAFILYSSGTTGLPKGVMTTHSNWSCMLSFTKDSRYNQQFLPGSEVTIALLPFFHAYGMYVLFSSVFFGRKVVIMKSFHPTVFLEAIQKYKITSLTIVPPIANFLAKSPLVEKYDTSSVEIISCGAAPLSRETQDILVKRFKLKRFRQGYGMTETTLGVLSFPMGESRLGSCGKILPNISAKVLDTETGKTLGPNQRGELFFKGALIMKGYAKNEEATRNAIDNNGWLRTGDIGYYDDDGFFYIVDRAKELIKYKGFQVPPAELEAILLTHPKIADAGVVGYPDERVGELPVAFVVKVQNQILTEKEVVNFVAKKVSPQKRLYGGVRFVATIPKNPSGKILRRVLRDQLAKMTSKL